MCLRESRQSIPRLPGYWSRSDIKVFISGFFVNAILAILLTFLGEKLNVDIYLAAIVVFVGRMFNNLGIIRRYYLSKVSKELKEKRIKN